MSIEPWKLRAQRKDTRVLLAIEKLHRAVEAALGYPLGKTISISIQGADLLVRVIADAQPSYEVRAAHPAPTKTTKTPRPRAARRSYARSHV